MSHITQQPKIVTLSWPEIVAKNVPVTEMAAAFGPNSLGICLIKDLPDFQSKRLNCMNAIREFALLPIETREKYAHAPSHYAYGWSHGKEGFAKGKPDYAKGSYYANPLADSRTDDEALKLSAPSTYTDNIWPTDDLPELEFAFKNMAKFSLQIGYEVADLLDQYLVKLSGNTMVRGTYAELITTSKHHKSRMLNYFPADAVDEILKTHQRTPSIGSVDTLGSQDSALEESTEDIEAVKNYVSSKNNSNVDSWCGWHFDHGLLTVLPSATFHDLKGTRIPPPSDDSGLHIMTRTGDVIKVSVPENCLAVQLGEMTQYFSGGHLIATPHCVRAGNNATTSRQQFASFMSPNGQCKLELPTFTKEYSKVVDTPINPTSYAPLRQRLVGAMDFSDFSSNTYASHTPNT